MDVFQNCMLWAVTVLTPQLITGVKPGPPENLKIFFSESSVKITWTITQPSVKTVRLFLFNSKGEEQPLDPKYIFKDIHLPESSFGITGLNQCEAYTIKVKSYDSVAKKFSKEVEQKFWFTEKNTSADINTNVTLKWRTTYASSFAVKAPKKKIVYTVDAGGKIVVNNDMSKYSYSTTNSTNIQDIEFAVINVEPADGGIYKSKSTLNQVTDECRLLIVKGKPKKPKLKFGNGYPFVGDDLVLICQSKVRRWPVDVSASLTYNFYGLERGKQRENKLIINNVTKSDHGANIWCQAVDDLDLRSKKSNAITLDVLYGPEDVILTPKDNSVTEIVGSQLGPIRCAAKCNPECQISWRKNAHTEIKSNGTLLVKSIKKEDDGIYQCTATNPMKKSKRLWLNVNVTVLYYPTIYRSLVFVNGHEKRNTITYIVSEGDRVQVTLTVDSNPNVNLTLNSTGFSLTRLNFNHSNQKYAIQLPALLCENSGKFLIEADNGLGKTAKWNTSFDIQCQPKEAKVFSEKIGTRLGATESISVLVVSNPKPTIKWSTNEKNLESWNIQQVKNNYQYKATSSVTINEESDFHLYTIIIRNKLGWILRNVTFIPEGKPEKPSNFSSGNVTFNQATLSWTAEFDGGSIQNFTILFKNENDDSWKSVKIPADNTQKGTKIHYTLGELFPFTSYDVDLVASNEYGSSNVSLRFKTEAEPVLTSSLLSETTYIYFGAVLAFLAVLAASGFIFFKKKRRENDSSSTNVFHAEVDKDTKNRNKKEQDDENIPGVSNAEYACVKKQTSNGSNKSAQQDKEENAEYAVVDKAHKNKVFDDESLYANQANESLPIINTEVKRPGRSVNKDGLIYIEVAFAKTKSDGGPMIIHGDKDRTTYVEIDFTKKGEPLPDNNED